MVIKFKVKSKFDLTVYGQFSGPTLQSASNPVPGAPNSSRARGRGYTRPSERSGSRRGTIRSNLGQPRPTQPDQQPQFTATGRRILTAEEKAAYRAAKERKNELIYIPYEPGATYKPPLDNPLMPTFPSSSDNPEEYVTSPRPELDVPWDPDFPEGHSTANINPSQAPGVIFMKLMMDNIIWLLEETNRYKKLNFYK